MGQLTSAQLKTELGAAIPGIAGAYGYDGIGNRVSETQNGRSGTYATNGVNAYVSRSRARTLGIMGKAAAEAAITVNNATASRMGEYFYGVASISGNSAQSVPIAVAGQLYVNNGDGLAMSGDALQSSGASDTSANTSRASAAQSASGAGRVLSAARTATSTGSGTTRGLSMGQMQSAFAPQASVNGASGASASGASNASASTRAAALDVRAVSF